MQTKLQKIRLPKIPPIDKPLDPKHESPHFFSEIAQNVDRRRKFPKPHPRRRGRWSAIAELPSPRSFTTVFERTERRERRRRGGGGGGGGRSEAGGRGLEIEPVLVRSRDGGDDIRWDSKSSAVSMFSSCLHRLPYSLRLSQGRSLSLSLILSAESLDFEFNLIKKTFFFSGIESNALDLVVLLLSEMDTVTPILLDERLFSFQIVILHEKSCNYP